MAKIVRSYSQKYQAIKSFTGLRFKHPEKLSPKNKAKITRIYNQIGEEMGFPVKSFPIKGKARNQKAIAKLNPRLKGTLTHPILPAQDNEFTEIRFKGKGKKARMSLVNPVAKVKIYRHEIQPEEEDGLNFQAIEKFMRKHQGPNSRGKVITKDGDIYANKINPRALDQYQDFVDLVKAWWQQYGQDPNNNHYMGRWLKVIEVRKFYK